MAVDVVVIDFPFTQIEYDKKLCEQKLNEVIEAACALSNSNGGVLKLHSVTKDNFNFDKLLRKVEQRIQELVGGYDSCKNFDKLPSTEDESHTEVAFRIASSETLCTVNCHLYLPHETQVNLMSPTERLDNLRKILTGPWIVECEQLVKLGSHRRDFVKAGNVGSPESKTEQFKKVKLEAMTSKHSRFACYVSAYANHRGGHIYYGIKDDGTVEGEFISHEKKQNITDRFTKAICKMLWPNGQPQRGKHWDVYYEPVVGKGCQQIPSTFVVVVTVVQCTGGVFAERPESYRMVNGKQEPIPFEIWKKRVISKPENNKAKGLGTKSGSNIHRFANRRDKTVKVPPGVARRKGGVSKLEQSCLQTRQCLARLRNNADLSAFDKCANELASQSDCLKVIVFQQRAACQYRAHRFQEAFGFLQMSKSLLRSAHENYPVLEIENIYWESVISHFLGNDETSDSLRILGMQKMTTCPADVMDAWFCYQEGRAIERLISENPREKSELIPQERLWYIEALKRASVLEESTSVADLKQRCHTRLAMLSLGYFVNDSEIARTEHVELDDMEEAERLLGIVDWSSKVQGWPMTDFCRCEYLLTRAQQNTRNWEQLRDQSYLEMALEECDRADAICQKKNFQELMIIVDAELHEINVNMSN